MIKEQLEDGEEEATCPSCSLIIKVIYNKVLRALLKCLFQLLIYFTLQDEFMQSEEVVYSAPKEVATAWHLYTIGKFCVFVKTLYWILNF